MMMFIIFACVLLTCRAVGRDLARLGHDYNILHCIIVLYTVMLYYMIVYHTMPSKVFSVLFSSAVLH